MTNKRRELGRKRYIRRACSTYYNFVIIALDFLSFCGHRAVQSCIVEDQSQLALRVGKIPLLPNVRILNLEAKALKQSRGWAVLKPDVEFVPVWNGEVRGRIYSAPALRIPYARAQSG